MGSPGVSLEAGVTTSLTCRTITAAGARGAHERQRTRAQEYLKLKDLFAVVSPADAVSGNLRGDSPRRSRASALVRSARREGGEMVLRWLAVSLIEASKTFRKLRGYAGRGGPKLVAALRAHDVKLNPPAVDAKPKAA